VTLGVLCVVVSSGIIQIASKGVPNVLYIPKGIMKGALNREGVPILNGMAHSQPK
jgi:hypothetical protein